MMLRKLAVSLAVAGVIGATNANALGLGEIKINSALNEPLSAEIKLLQVRQLSPLQIQPRMADIDEFALAGLDRSRFLSDVSFQVKVNPDGTGLITLRSKNPVREPFLNFLVEINWPNGRLVREYTLLLDPPVFDPTPVRQTVQPAAAVEAPAAKKPVSPRPAVTAPAVTGSRSAGQSQVYVDTKDTLWGIALKHRPAKSVPVRRMMIAIQDKNPDAFIGGNINRLKAGVTLQMPTPEELNKLDNAQVLREFERQTESWRNQTKQEKAPVEASAKKPVTDAVPEQPAPEDDKSAELKIVTPKDKIEPEEGMATDQSDNGMGEEPKPEMKDDEAATEETGDAQTDTEKALLEKNQDLEDRLNQSLENVDKVSRENAELNERLDSIQYELEKLREMLELKDQEMASLQNEVAKAKAAPPPAPAPAPAPEKSLLDTILQSPAMLGGLGAGLIALLAGLLFFLRRNKKEESAEDNDGLVQVPEELNAPKTDDDLEAMAAAEAAEELTAEPEAEEVADDLEEISDLDDLDDLEDLSDVDDLDIGDEEDLLNDSDLNLNDADEISDLDDLDLDMDLNLEDEMAGGALDKVEENDEADDELDALLADDEFDLGIDDELETAEEDAAEDDSLDAILDEVPEAEEETATDDALDDILGEASADESAEEDVELDLELGDDLDFDVQEMAQPEAAEAAGEADDDGLDFVVDEVPELVETEEAAEAEVVSADDDLDLELGEDLDDILSSTEESEASAEAPAETDSADDDLEALMASDLDMSELEEAPAEADAEAPAAADDEELDADLEAMLAANPDPQDLAVPVKDQIEVEEDFEDMDFESDEGFDALLDKVDEDIDLARAAEPEAEEEASEEESDAAADDLDAMLDDIGVGIEEEMAAAPQADGKDQIDLEDDGLLSGAHDLEAELDSELSALLEGGDNDFELDETMADAEDGSVDEDFDELAGLNLLEGADEVETKLDLARAYMDMEDLDGAKDILEEIILEGSDEQKQEAEALIRSINEK
ncbi:FimV/HubP family polar landmark protein [Neptuniibacter halophilus]|uniref:FimV/HubP family polar landmark protein n=1 Tax=Neptuniibacter halophilus TaxID=651666 RepID=UPI0025727768|nr:FimV/HubP family polar landmark protein [Neptuniibacter halophilus]